MRVALLGSCGRPTEAKLIGTWNVPVIDASTRITYSPDHTCDIWSDGMGVVTTDTATWRLKGDQLVTRHKGKEIKSTIVITRDELKIKDAGQDTFYTWTRVK